MSFGTNLQYIRRTRDLTQEQLAQQLQVSRQSVSKWESDAMLPELDKLIFLCDQYGCTLDSLLRGDLAAEASEDTIGYDRHFDRIAKKLALGTGLVLMAPASLGYCEFFRLWNVGTPLEGGFIAVYPGMGNFPEEVCGIVFFLILIAAVSILLLYGMTHDQYVKKHPFVEPFYTELQLDAHAAWFTRQIVVGVAAVLGGLVLLIAGSLIAEGSEALQSLLLGFFLTVLAWAVSRLTLAGILHEKFDIEAYNRKNALTPEAKKQNIRIEQLCGCIMLTATAVFLVTGIVWQAWDINWLAFAVGGIGCAIVSVALGRDDG